MTRGLKALLALDDVQDFLRGYPEKRFYAQGPVERLRGLVDHDLDALIRMRKHHTKAFFRSVESEPKSVTCSPGQERTFYDAGHTLYFHSLRSPEIDSWVDSLNADLGLLNGATRVSAFASRRGAGLGMHYDPNDNFVCQARGRKRWRIADNAHVRHPSVGHTFGAQPSARAAAQAPNGFPTDPLTASETVELLPGAVMFMPRGMWHATETMEEESLHFNVQSGIATWKDIVEFLLSETPLLHREELREPVLNLFEDGRMRADVEGELKRRFSTLAEALGELPIDIDQDSFQKFIARRLSAG